MDIGNLRNNTIFYDGYEGETEIVLTVKEDKTLNIHLWEGYMDDIFADPTLDGTGWLGFTRDIHQMEGIFSEEISFMEINAEEYLQDLLSYQGKQFDYEESAEALSLLICFLTCAVENSYTVVVERV